MNYIENYFPKPLLDDIVNGNCIPIIGAGFSLNATIPENKKMLMWDGLGKAISELIQNYDYTNPLDAISAFEHEYTRVKLIERLSDLLLICDIKPGPTHKEFAKLPFERVITTNFDNLLEQSYEQCITIIEESQISVNHSPNMVRLIKMHGDLNHSDRLVATEEDYDLFIERFPIISTFISNLLITKTPLFIGYSIDDPDFRQLWKVVNSRLGKNKRPAYTIKLNADYHEISKFERRDVKVINIKDKETTYSDMLSNVFAQLSTYWNNKLLQNSVFTLDESKSELSKEPSDFNRLCLFSIPMHLLAIYKQYIFPIVENYGLVPISADEVLTKGETIRAKISALIARAEFLIFDISGNNKSVIYELNIALSIKKSSEKIIIITDSKTNIRDHFFEAYSFRFLHRPDDIVNYVDTFESSFDKVFSSLTSQMKEMLFQEPARLFEKKEYKSAIISAISLLEQSLLQKIEKNKFFVSHRIISLSKIIDIAFEGQLIDKKEHSSIKNWNRLRNRAVHKYDSIVQRKQAEELIQGINLIILRLNNQ